MDTDRDLSINATITDVCQCVAVLQCVALSNSATVTDVRQFVAVYSDVLQCIAALQCIADLSNSATITNICQNAQRQKFEGPRQLPLTLLFMSYV